MVGEIWTAIPAARLYSQGRRVNTSARACIYFGTVQVLVPHTHVHDRGRPLRLALSFERDAVRLSS
jgi:hypothetical protein